MHINSLGGKNKQFRLGMYPMAFSGSLQYVQRNSRVQTQASSSQFEWIQMHVFNCGNISAFSSVCSLFVK